MSEETETQPDEAAAPHNTGVTVIRPARAEETERTIVVLGTGRGGTSAVAGMLAQMGVFVGDRLGEVNYEDRKLSLPLEADDRDGAAAVVREYDERHPVWAWKRPSAVRYLDWVESEFRNPYYVCVFRDAAAVATRRQVSMGFDPLPSALGALRAYVRIVKFLMESSERPALMLSYEKLLTHADAAARELAAIALIEDPASIGAAAASVEASPYEYRLKSQR